MAVGCARQFVVQDFSCRFHRSCSLAKFIAKVQRVPSSTIGISTVPSWKDPGRLATGRGKLAKWRSQRGLVEPLRPLTIDALLFPGTGFTLLVASPSVRDL